MVCAHMDIWKSARKYHAININKLESRHNNTNNNYSFYRKTPLIIGIIPSLLGLKDYPSPFLFFCCFFEPANQTQKNRLYSEIYLYVRDNGLIFG